MQTKNEKVQVTLKSVGSENSTAWDIPASNYEVIVTRTDNLAPSPVEVMNALQIALSMFDKNKL
jgi:hypothetical protein